MKKIAAVAAAVLVISLFAGCKDNKSSVSSEDNPPSNIESFAKVGRIDTLDVKIGDSLESVCELYNTTLEQVKHKAETEASNAEMTASDPDDESGAESEDEASDNESEAQVFETELSYSTDEELGKLSAEGVIYYFNESSPENGIILIVAFDDPYLLTVGSATPDIVQAMVTDKPEYTGETEDGDWFFIFGEPPQSTQKIIYSFEKYKVQFLFQEDLLFCVMLYDSEQWAGAADMDTESSEDSSSQSSE